jgi:hypothetical protein
MNRKIYFLLGFLFAFQLIHSSYYSQSFLTNGQVIYYSKDTISCGNLMVSVQELVEDNRPLKIYPNPASENLFLSELNENQIGEKALICDYLGQKIVEFQIESTNQKIDASHFESGVYFLNISGRMGKFIIK